MCVSVLFCVLFCFVLYYENLCQACLCLNLRYSFLITFSEQITGIIRGLKDLNMLNVFGTYDEVPLKI